MKNNILEMSQSNVGAFDGTYQIVLFDSSLTPSKAFIPSSESALDLVSSILSSDEPCSTMICEPGCKCNTCSAHAWTVGAELEDVYFFNLRELNNKILWMSADDTDALLHSMYRHHKNQRNQ